jgi:hypothetical protein
LRKNIGSDLVRNAKQIETIHRKARIKVRWNIEIKYSKNEGVPKNADYKEESECWREVSLYVAGPYAIYFSQEL